jgi:hypothetical protein
MLAPVVENRTVGTRLEDQLGLDDEANSQIANAAGGPGRLGLLLRHGHSGTQLPQLAMGMA